MADIVETAASLAASKRQVSITQNAPGVIRTLAAVLAVLFLFGLLVIWALGFREWPKEVAGERVRWLAWIGIVSIIGFPLIVIAFASPYLGRVQAHAGPVEFDIEGEKPSA